MPRRSTASRRATILAIACLAITCTILACPAPALAEAPATDPSAVASPAVAAPTPEPAALEPLTITASRYDRPLAGTPAMVTVLTADDLAPLAAMPVEDILATRAGVSLVRTGGPGQQVSLFLRGTNSDSTLVLVDGVKINGGTFGGASLQHLRGADITRIEVIRGPRSTLYGSEAIGGVIAISTRRGDGDRLHVHAGGGSDRSTDFRVQSLHSGAGSHLAAGIGYLATDGDPLTDRTGITGEHDNRSGTLSGSMTTAAGNRVGIEVWAARGTTHYADCIYDASFTCIGTTPLAQEFLNATANAWGEYVLGPQATLRAHLGHAGDDITQRQTTDGAQTRRLVGGLELHRRAGAHALVAGIDAEREDVRARIYGADLHSLGDNQALFLRDEWTQGAHSLAAGLRHTRHDSFGTHDTGEASYALQLAPRTLAWLAWGRGFRAPDASERFGFGGNPLLAPERSDSREIGLRHRHGLHEFTVAGFHQEIADLIDYPAPAFTATNIARARITGTELGWSWRDDDTRLDAFVTLQDPVDDGTGARLSRRPEKQLSASARHRRGALEWRAALLAMDARDNSAFDATVLPGFAVLDLGVAWTPTPAWTLDLRVDNVGDRDYALASGAFGDYRMPDRAFFLGIDWRH